MLRWDALELLKTLGSRMDADIASGEIGGAVAVVSQGGAVLCRVVRGYSDVAAGVPLRYDNLFRLASMTKSLTAAAVMQQIERGKLHFEDKVSAFLPAFCTKWIGKLNENGAVVPEKPAENELTVHHLLTHTGGVLSGPVGNAQYATFPPQALTSARALVDYIGSDVLLDFEPGSAFGYSGVGGMDILARLVELVSDMPFEDYLTQRLFAPLEMPDTTFTPTAEQRARLVAMHDTRDGKSITVDLGDVLVPILPNAVHSASASLLGTAEDYLHFAVMLANDGSFRGRQVMKPETVLAMRTSRLPATLAGLAPGTNWGAGVMVRERTVLPAGSFGWSGAYGTHFWADPVNHLAAVYMRNSLQANGAGAATAFRFEGDVMSCAQQG